MTNLKIRNDLHQGVQGRQTLFLFSMTFQNSSGKASQQFSIDKTTPVTDIVLKDHHTADVFMKYDIEFCCGGKWPLEMVCKSKQLNTDEILQELEQAMETLRLPAGTSFEDWSTGFLIDFIVNIYHRHLKKALTGSIHSIDRFLESHLKKFPQLESLPHVLIRLNTELNKRLSNEEHSFFPYINQITNAHLRNESYAGLLVKTLRKPWQETTQREYDQLIQLIHELRELTNQYSLPANACVTHRVSFSKLCELDNELNQYLHIEHQFLLPRVAQVEKALLS